MSHDSAAPETGRLTHRPWLAAVLSFLIPGMGQAYAGTAAARAAAGGADRPGDRAHHRHRDRCDRRPAQQLFSSGFLIAVLVVNGLVLPGAGSRSPTPASRRGPRSTGATGGWRHGRRRAAVADRGDARVDRRGRAPVRSALTQVFEPERARRSCRPAARAARRRRRSRSTSRSSSGTAPSGSTSSCSGPMRPPAATPSSPTSCSSSASTRWRRPR